MTRRRHQKHGTRCTPSAQFARAINEVARAEHGAREAVRRKHRRAAKRPPKRLDAYDWPSEQSDAPERRSA